ncbi:cation-transporting P-type ATPase [Streptomyces sp. NPDC007063]|uniref:cation-transporting P-type ATPase n=1 Tax=Streptomyces sp. NPDC007063 TaxID=3364772 RepID=UPI00369E55C7
MQPAASRTEQSQLPVEIDPREPLARLRQDLRTGPEGLSRREAERRAAVYGPNEVRREHHGQLRRELARQLVHPLALLLTFPVLVWGADELRRSRRRRRTAVGGRAAGTARRG